MIDPADINLAEVLGNWFGAPASTGQIQVDYTWLPEPLKEWYSLSGCWQKLRSADNRVYDADRIRIKDGKAEFVADSTGDWFWAFDLEDSTLVYEAELRGKWQLIPESLSEYLVHLTLLATAALGDFARMCPQVPNEVVSQILAPMEEVNFGGWRWPRPGHRIFMSEVLIADIGPAMDFRQPWRNREGFSAVSVSAIAREGLGYLDDIPSAKWIIHPYPDGSFRRSHQAM